VAILAAMAVIAGGCDLMVAPASPIPSRLSRTPEPLPTAEPEASDEVPTPRPLPAAGTADLVDAANALADLDSYRFSVRTTGFVPASSRDGLVTMLSTLVLGAEPAARFTIVGIDGIEGSRLEAIVIGDRAWVRDAGRSWVVSPGGAADFDAAFTALSPIDLAGQFEGLAPGLTTVGAERRNGIASRRYHVDSGAAGAADAGLSAGAADAWLAVHGGYLVGLHVNGTWDIDGVPTPVTLRLEVSHVDDPANVIRPPG
jgi:hypothetical protein